MAFNLFIAYDLMNPGQNYDQVRDQIKGLGQWAQIQYSMFYVHTVLNPQQAHDHIRLVMDTNDRLAVIEANSAVITVYPKATIDAINNVWFAN